LLLIAVLEEFLQPSDEEVLQYVDSKSEEDAHDSSEQSDAVSGSEDGENEDEESTHDTTRWGTSKADYYDADVIETEADALEEEVEARRIQQKRVQSMAEADFGFDEAQWTQESTKPNNDRRALVEKLPDVQISEHTSSEDKLKILQSRYPEFEPLAKDFRDLQMAYQDLRLASESVQLRHSRGKKIHNGQPLPVVKCRALSAYLGAIAMYFVLLTSPQKDREGQISAMPANDLREHSVMETLVTCRQLWQKARDLKEQVEMGGNVGADTDTAGPAHIDGNSNGNSNSNTEVRQPVYMEKDSLQEVPAGSKLSKRKSVRTDAMEDLEGLSKRVGEGLMESPGPAGKQQKMKKRRRQNDLETLLGHLDSPLQAGHPDDQSEFGDEKPLTVQEAAEKARRKKSLRFYSSQIVQKSNKRGVASRDAGGDDDLPRKERLKDRQARLLQLAEKRGREAPDLTEQLDKEGADGGSQSESNEYYDMVVTKSKQKKADKKARDDAYKEAAKQGAEVYVEEEIGPDGKRAITYAIEKNKGLMPRRKKDVRNPRVKKRKKYDEKMKKLGSVRQLYKGGEGRGGYGGELTGIKTNLVKSVKL
jgi:U3 small nucleolar RNA-associated protein 3